MNDPELHEAFLLWPAWHTIHGHLLTTDARTSDPRDLIGPLVSYGHDRAACLLFAHHRGDSLAESHKLVGDLLTLAHNGRRPRYLAELGLCIEDFS